MQLAPGKLQGVSNCETSGVVRLNAERRASRLQLKVQDSGSGMKQTVQPGHGIGLKNTRERLAHFYRGDFEFQAGPVAEGGFEVFIDIPYERGRSMKIKAVAADDEALRESALSA